MNADREYYLNQFRTLLNDSKYLNYTPVEKEQFYERVIARGILTRADIDSIVNQPSTEDKKNQQLDEFKRLLTTSKYLNYTPVEKEQFYDRVVAHTLLTRQDVDVVLANSIIPKANLLIESPVMITQQQQQTIVRGPYALEKLVSPSGDRTIYLFYDHHYKPKTCPDNSISITDFIDDVLKHNRDYTIDFMLEMNLSHIISKTRNSHLEDIRLLLKDCYSIDKSKCTYENTRVHWVDVRFGGLLKDYLDILDSIQALMRAPSDYILRPDVDIVTIHRNFLNSLRVIDSRFSIDDVLRDYKIIKQIDNITDGNVRIKLLTEIKNKIRFSHDKFVQLLNRNNLNYADKKLTTALLQFTGLFMDAYTVSRMLRNFGNSTMNNIIVYAGGFHSLNISQMLQNLDYKVADVVAEENRNNTLTGKIDEFNRCLDITKMLPLFR